MDKKLYLVRPEADAIIQKNKALLQVAQDYIDKITKDSARAQEAMLAQLVVTAAETYKDLRFKICGESQPTEFKFWIERI